MFTALFMTRFYFTGWIEKPHNQELKMSHWMKKTEVNFLKYSKVSFCVALSIISIGCTLVCTHRASIFGIDFTGGYSTTLEMAPLEKGTYIPQIEKALLKAGAELSDFELRELSSNHQIRLHLGRSMEQVGKPFAHIEEKKAQENGELVSEKRARIEWIVAALEKEQIQLTPNGLVELETSWTAMSGKMSDTMKKSAFWGLFLSFLCIFVYLSIRFEYKFAAGALLCLFHDVLITIGAIGLMHAMRFPIQIDLNTIAALMTIIGYSLNDTIIIFDRIREEMSLQRKTPFTDLINHALNATLSRTTITSGTTLLVLIALVAFGGFSIFGFSLVMTIGIFFGTLSSWFIASPLLLLFHKKEERQSESSYI
jgi:SecD/SecF fusion protein